MATVSHPVATQATQTTVTLLQPSETHGSAEEGKDGVIGALEANAEEGVSDVKDQDKGMEVEQATGADVESTAPLFIYSGRY
jgi:hypothetical protein